MTEMTAVVRNEHGIHCRPSAVIAKAVMGYVGSIKVLGNGHECDPRSVMALMTLGLFAGSEVRITVDGPDEEAVCRKLVDLCETHFDFPPRPEGEPLKIPTELL